MTHIDIDLLQTWVGRTQVLTDNLHPFAARAFAAALDRPVLPDAGELLPPAWQWLYFLDTPRASGTGMDGHPKTGECLPPPPLPRRMWAAGNMRIEQPLRLGGLAERRTTIKSINAKTGRSGRLVFVNLEHAIVQNDVLCIHEEQNLVYREMPSASTSLPPGEVGNTDAEWTQTITPNPVLLFRYSAVTYNSHRIHYDREYAIEQEFYPSLVVHAPLLASLLLELVHSQLPEATLTTFKFIAVRPTFVSQPVTANGKRDGKNLRLWTANEQGELCMSAIATVA